VIDRFVTVKFPAFISCEETNMATQQQRQRNLRGQYRNPTERITGERVRGRRGVTVAVGSLIAGAGIGLAAMYLFDFEAGARRRRRLIERSANLLTSSKQLTQQAAESAIARSQSLSDGIIDRAGQAKEYAVGAIDDARRRANIALGREREHHYVAQTAGAIGSIALGAGLAWIFDHQLGRSRRARLRDSGKYWAGELGNMVRHVRRRAADRVRGQIHEAREHSHVDHPIDDASFRANDISMPATHSSPI